MSLGASRLMNAPVCRRPSTLVECTFTSCIAQLFLERHAFREHMPIHYPNRDVEHQCGFIGCECKLSPQRRVCSVDAHPSHAKETIQHVYDMHVGLV
jgi:hypothetical protein